jgi:tubulin-specific chaperone B
LIGSSGADQLYKARQTMNSDMMAVRNYVTARDDANRGGNNDNIHGGGRMVVDITHSNLAQRHLEIPFDAHSPVSELQHKIYQQTGTLVDDQLLYVIEDGTVVAEMLDTRRPIGYYIHKRFGLTVHCVDTNPHSISAGGALENVNLVPKFQLTDEEYHKRKGTLRDWKTSTDIASYRQHLVEHQGVVAAQRHYKEGKGLPLGYRLIDAATGKVERDDSIFDIASVAHCAGDHNVGQRCEVQPGGRRGKIACTVPSIPSLGHGYWVGVILDEPVGKHDGTIHGVSYFDAPPQCGIFCRGMNVAVGEQYVERDLFDDDEEEENDGDEDDDEL